MRSYTCPLIIEVPCREFAGKGERLVTLNFPKYSLK